MHLRPDDVGCSRASGPTLPPPCKRHPAVAPPARPADPEVRVLGAHPLPDRPARGERPKSGNEARAHRPFPWGRLLACANEGCPTMPDGLDDLLDDSTPTPARVGARCASSWRTRSRSFATPRLSWRRQRSVTGLRPSTRCSPSTPSPSWPGTCSRPTPLRPTRQSLLSSRSTASCGARAPRQLPPRPPSRRPPRLPSSSSRRPRLPRRSADRGGVRGQVRRGEHEGRVPQDARRAR
jgi:hypothetical protein